MLILALYPNLLNVSFPNKKFLYRLGIGIEHHFLVHLHQRIAYKETILKWQSLRYRRILLFLVGYIFVYAFLTPSSLKRVSLFFRGVSMILLTNPVMSNRTIRRMHMHFWDEHKTITRYYEMKMSGVCEKYNLRQMEYDILMFLYNNPEYNTAADIVRIRKSTKSHVSTSLKVLEDRGLIERRVDPANKKRVTLHLLQLANEVIEDGKWAQKEFAQDMFDGLTEEEIKVFMNVFQKVYDNAERMISIEKNAGFNGSNF